MERRRGLSFPASVPGEGNAGDGEEEMSGEEVGEKSEAKPPFQSIEEGRALFIGGVAVAVEMGGDTLGGAGAVLSVGRVGRTRPKVTGAGWEIADTDWDRP